MVDLLVFLRRKLFGMWILFTLIFLPGLFKFNILFLKFLLVLIESIPYSRFTGLNNILYVNVYIYIHSHPQTDLFHSIRTHQCG